MAEYSSLGLWDEGGELDMKKVKVSRKLKKLLARWIQVYTERINWDNPGAEKVLTNEFKQELNTLEDEVFEQVRKELGRDHELVFESRKFSL